MASQLWQRGFYAIYVAGGAQQGKVVAGGGENGKTQDARGAPWLSAISVVWFTHQKINASGESFALNAALAPVHTVFKVWWWWWW